MPFQIRYLLASGMLLLATVSCAGRPGDAAASVQSPTSRGASIRLAIDSFALHFHGSAEGSQTLSLTATDSGYRYIEWLSLPPVMTRVAEVDFDSALHVRHTRSDTRVGSETGRSDIRYVDRRAQGTITPMTGQGAREVSVDTLLPPGAFDGLALYPVLLSRHWEVGQVDTLTIWDTDERSITQQTIRVTGVERVRVPAGEFDALRAELSTTQLPVTLWISATVPHRLLKVGSANGESVLVH